MPGQWFHRQRSRLQPVSRNGKRWGIDDAELKRDFVWSFGRLNDGSSPAKLPGISMDNALYNQIVLNDIDRNFGSGIKMVRTSFYNLIGLNTLTDDNEGSNPKLHYFGILVGFASADESAWDLDFVPSHGNQIFGNNAARSAGRVFGVPVVYRILIVALAVCSPLVSLGLELGNVSVAVVALCILVLTGGSKTNAWLPALALTVALILKPHIAFWTVLAMLLTRTLTDRTILRKAAVLTAGALGLIVVWMLLDHSFLSQSASYRAMVVSELSNGSMAPGNRDLMEIVVQITSFAHLLGYLLTPSLFSHVLNLVVLGGLASALVWSALMFSRASLQPHFVVAPAVFAFGLVATYHREADGMLLLLLLPLLFFRLHNRWSDLWAWGALTLLIAGSLGPSLPMLRWLADRNGIYAAMRFLALRQAAIVNLSLTVMLIAALAVGRRTQAGPQLQRANTPESPV